jgi:MarR family transcriptional regulator, organic hydroperoxide resistance regulator
MHRPTRTFYLFNRVNAAVNIQLEKLLRAVDITVAQYTCMSRIRGHEVMSSAKLARAHRVSPQTMYEMITNLEKRGFLIREKGLENKKQLLVSLTRRGRKTLELCDRRVDEIEPLIFAGVNTANHALLREMLQIVIENTTRAELGEVANDPAPLPRLRVRARK